MVRKHQRNEKKFGVLKQSTKRKMREGYLKHLKRKHDGVFVIKVESEFDNCQKSNDNTIDFSDLIGNQGLF